jgi:FAD/FMN-containing dehydrogenase
VHHHARAVFYGGIDKRPAVIVRVANVEDVRRVVAVARDEGYELAIRSGGYSVVGHCTTERVTELAKALQPNDDAAYVGFLNDDGQARIRSAYPPPAWDRLTKIKRTYDPGNLFRLNQNIPPNG